MSARARRQRGLTLIELMVALAIFAVLGVLSYRALAEVGTSRRPPRRKTSSAGAASAAHAAHRPTCIQVVAPPPRGRLRQPQASPAMLLGRAARRGRSCSSCASTTPAGCAGSATGWWTAASTGCAGAAATPSAARRRTLLDKVRDVRWRFLHQRRQPGRRLAPGERRSATPARGGDPRARARRPRHPDPLHRPPLMRRAAHPAPRPASAAPR